MPFQFPPEIKEESLIYGSPEFDEGPVPRIAPGLPANPGVSPSVFRLHRVADGEQMVEATVFDVANFAYDPPPGHVPQGPMQWYVKHPGDRGFGTYGAVFQYKFEANSYWDRQDASVRSSNGLGNPNDEDRARWR